MTTFQKQLDLKVGEDCGVGFIWRQTDELISILPKLLFFTPINLRAFVAWTSIYGTEIHTRGCETQLLLTLSIHLNYPVFSTGAFVAVKVSLNLFLRTLLLTLCLYSSLFLSPQWWNSADSKRDQPRNHPRTEDQGQVWAGWIFSCEYRGNRHSTHRQTGWPSEPVQRHMTPWVCFYTQIKNIYGFIHINLDILYCMRTVIPLPSHTSSSADNCFYNTAVQGRQSATLCLAHVSSVYSYSLRHLTLPQATQLFKCHRTTWVFVSQKETTWERLCVPAHERERVSEWHLMGNKEERGEKIHVKSKVPPKKPRSFIVSMDNIHKALWWLSLWVEAF